MREGDGVALYYEPHCPAVDGQCGAILEAYRATIVDTDHSWFYVNWPRVKKAMEYAIVEWDRNEDGVLSRPQHNTLDAAIDGSSSWLGSMYLAALTAAARMARIAGDDGAAERYTRIRKSGSRNQDETLFNGEYYVHIPEGNRFPDAGVPLQGYGNGCEIDQVLGQWWARQLGLGSIYPADHVRSALRSIYRYNAVRHPVWRGFTQPDDRGLVICAYPHGEPSHGYRQLKCTEHVMTGFEYAVAAAMVQAGLVNEGLDVVRAVHDRHDGRFRDPGKTTRYGGLHSGGNPFGDDECGIFYARAMSVWSVLLACQGFLYDGPAGRIGFRPVWQPEDHVSFFTAAEGWGLFSQRRVADRQISRIELRYGTLRISSMVFGLSQDVRFSRVRVMLGGRQLDAEYVREDDYYAIALSSPLLLHENDAVDVEIDLSAM